VLCLRLVTRLDQVPKRLARNLAGLVARSASTNTSGRGTNAGSTRELQRLRSAAAVRSGATTDGGKARHAGRLLFVGM
jgi:hypothetical protein